MQLCNFNNCLANLYQCILVLYTNKFQFQSQMSCLFHKETGFMFLSPCVCVMRMSYIYINVWKSSQRMNLRDVGSETSVNDTVQTNTNDK